MTSTSTGKVIRSPRTIAVREVVLGRLKTYVVKGGKVLLGVGLGLRRKEPSRTRHRGQSMPVLKKMLALK
jgi:hypothetical protein